MRIFLFLVLLLSPLLSAAETVYVTDQLKLSLRSEPASNAPPLASVLSGDALEVLEKGEGHWKVRTTDNVEGWVNSNYVTPDAPAIARLRELEASRGKADSAIGATRDGLSNGPGRNKQLEKEIEDLRRKNHELQATLYEAFNPSAAGAGPALGESLFRYRWGLGAGVMVLLPLFGFVGGIRWYRRRISARLGGFQF